MDSLDSLLLEERELPHGRQNEFLIVILLSFITYLTTVDSMLLMPLMNVVMDTYSIGAKTSTIIISIYSFTAFLSGVLSSAFIDKYDRKTSLLVTFIGFTIGTALCGFGKHFALMILYRGITGIFGGIIGGIAIAIVSDLIPYERRTTAMSIISLSFAIAAITGIPIGIYLSQHYNLFVPFLLIAVISVFTIVAIMLWIPPMKKHLSDLNAQKASYSNIINVFKDSNQVLALLLAFLLVFSHQVVIIFVVPYFENNVGFSQDWIPILYFIGGVVTVVSSLVIGKLSDKYGNKSSFSLLLFLSFFPIIATTHITKASILLVIIICVFFFMFAAGRMIPAYTVMSAAMTKEKRGAFMNMRSAFLELGTFVASVCSSFIVAIDAKTGWVTHYDRVGYVSVLAGVLCWILIYKIKIVSKD